MAARGGEKGAFVEIVSRYQGTVTGVTLAILHDFAASEDAAQEAFVKAWQKLSQLERPEKLRPWLSQIARTTALMHLRKHHPGEPLDSVSELAVDRQSHPDELVANAEERAVVLSALEALPENYRLPLVLFYREEKSVRAVAEALDLSESLVRKRLSRGREMLRQRTMNLFDSVLRETLPKALFTAAVAASIGALSSPSAIAATAFTTSTTPATTVPIVTTTAMTTSKLTLTTAAVIAAVCIPVGYTAGMLVEDRTSDFSMNQSLLVEPASHDGVEASPEVPKSRLVLEWRSLKEEYGTDGKGLRKLHEVVRAMEQPSLRRRALMSTLIAEWAQREPASGVTFFRAKGLEGWQRDLFIEEALKSDAGALIDGLMASGSGWESLARRFLPQIAQHAPTRFSEVARQVPAATNYWDKGLREAFEILAEERPELAKITAEQMSGRKREEALSGVAMAWARKDGNAAFAWANSLEDQKERDEVARAVLLGWVKEDPAAALSRLGEVAPGGRQGYFATTTEGQVLKIAGEHSFDATVAWMRDNPGKISDSSGLSDAAGQRLLTAPAEFLSLLQDEGGLAPMLRAIEISLLNEGVGARREVWEWTLDQETSESVRSLREHILRNLGWQDPKVGMSLVDQMAPGEDRDKALEKVAGAVSQKIGSLAVFDDLTRNASSEWKAALAYSTLPQLAFQVHLVDPSAWVDRLELVVPEKRPQSVQLLAQAWAKSDWNASLEWVESLDNSRELSEGIGGVAAGWFEVDPDGAEQWASTLEGAERDAAASKIAQGLVKNDALCDAWSWLEKVESPQKLYDALERIVPRVSGAETTEVLEWIVQSNLPPEQKETLFNFIENTRF